MESELGLHSKCLLNPPSRATVLLDGKGTELKKGEGTQVKTEDVCLHQQSVTWVKAT